MNGATATFAVIVLIFAWRGYRKGFIGSIARVVTLLVAYPAALFLTKPCADLLLEYTGLDGMIVYFIAGMVVFVLASALVGIPLNRLARPQTDDEYAPEFSATSRFCGAGAGLLIGSVVGLLAVYGIGLAQTGLAQASPSTASRSLGSPVDRFLETSAKNFVSLAAATAADFVFDDETTTEVTRAFVEEPREMFGHVQQVMNNREQVLAVMNDEQVAAMVSSGDVDGLMRVPDFQALVNDEHLQALMPQSAAPGEQAAQVTAKKLVGAWGRINEVRNDPEFMAIVADPELQRQLQAPDMSLMMNPKLNKLAELIFADAAPVQ